MARKRKKGGGGGGGGHAGQIGGVNTGLSDWNTNFGGWANDAIDYGQNNEFSDAASQYITGMLGGNAPNKWMDNLYGGLDDINLDESMGFLRDFIGGQGGGGGSTNNPYGARGSYGRGGGGGGGAKVDIQDSSAGKGAFKDTAQWFLDRDARLNPADDPTLQPYVDAMQQEMEESSMRSRGDLAAGSSGNNMWGGSHYDALQQYARDDADENMRNTLAGVYQGSRESALGSMKDILGLANERDIAEGNIDAQLAAASMAANASRSSSGAMAGAQRDSNRLQAIGMMLGGSQFGMGLKGDMASLLQSGQLGALQAGQGYGQLGAGGYDQAANFGQLGIGALGALGNNINSYWNSVYSRENAQRDDQFRNQQYQHNLPWQDAGNMIDLLRGLGELSGDYDQMPYIERPLDNTGNAGMNAFLTGAGTGFGNYFDYMGR